MIEWLLRFVGKPAPPAPLPADQDEADQELEHAKQELRRSEQEATKAQQVAGHLKNINEENHFAERALMALRGIVQ